MNVNKQRQADLISFDLWGTLIEGAGGPGESRAALLHEHLEPGVPVDEFKAVMRTIDRQLDETCETTGVDLDYRARIGALCTALQIKTPPAEEIEALYATRLELLLQHPPRLRWPGTPAMLEGLDVPAGIVSNTGFIGGVGMRGALRQMGVLQYFPEQYHLFSNEVGYSKPDRRIFAPLVQRSGIEPSRIAHIGDNRRADYHGATAMGMRAVHLPPDLPIDEAVDMALYASAEDLQRHAEQAA